jgi:hypothetical protein
MKNDDELIKCLVSCFCGNRLVGNECNFHSAFVSYSYIAMLLYNTLLDEYQTQSLYRLIRPNK